MRRTISVVAAAAAIAVVPAGVAEAKKLRGVVVDRPAAKSFVLATKKGKLVTVNSSRPAKVGQRVTARGKMRAGELNAKRVRVQGKARRAKARGTVVAARSAGFLLSGKSATVSVANRRSGARAASAGGPGIGSIVATRLKIDADGDLTARRVRTVGHDDEFEVEGIITAIDEAARRISLLPEEWDEEDADEEDADEEGEEDADEEGEEEADEENEEEGRAASMDSGGEISVYAPEGFDLSICRVGNEAEFEVRYDETMGYVITDLGDSDSSEDSSSDGEDWDWSKDRSVSNGCGDYDESSDASGDAHESDSSSDSSRD